MPPEGITCLPMHEILSYEETIHLCRIFAELGVRKVKITGGEPFVRRNVCHLIRAIKDIPGIDSVTITTNGILALQHLKELKDAGLIQGEVEAPKVKYCINRDNWLLAKELFDGFLEQCLCKKGGCC